MQLKQAWVETLGRGRQGNWRIWKKKSETSKSSLKPPWVQSRTGRNTRSNETNTVRFLSLNVSELFAREGTICEDGRIFFESLSYGIIRPMLTPPWSCIIGSCCQLSTATFDVPSETPFLGSSLLDPVDSALVFPDPPSRLACLPRIQHNRTDLAHRAISRRGRERHLSRHPGLMRAIARARKTLSRESEMSLKAFVAIFRFRGSTPDQIPLVNPEDIVFIPEDDSSANPFVVSLKMPRTQGEMPRRFLRAVPEPKASEYLAAFEAGFMNNLSSTATASGGAASPAPGGTPPPAAAAQSAPLLAPGVPPPTAPAGATDPTAAASALTYKAVLFAGEGGVRLYDVARSVQEGSTQLLLFDLVGGIYRHKPATSATRRSELVQLVSEDGRPLTRACWVLGAGAFGATRPPQSPEERAFFNNESYIASAVRHPNVLSAAGPPIDIQLEPGGPLLRCLVTPFCEGGDLDGVIRRHLRSPSAGDRQERWLLSGDLLRSLAYLHGKPFQENEHRVLHNDIKPANVLLRRQMDPATKTERPMALLADLGLACVYTGGSLNYGLLSRGTPGFMAPELFAMPGGPEGRGLRPGNTPATDVYAMGATLYCLYSQTDTAHKTEEQPSEAELREAFAEVAAREQAVARGPKGAGGDSLAELLVQMCSENPTARPSAKHLLAALEALEAAEASALVASLPAAAEQELRESMGLATGRPVTLPDLRGWLAKLAPPSCPAQALVGLLQCPEVTSRPAVLVDLLRALNTMCDPKHEGSAKPRAALGKAGVAAPLVGLLTAHPDLPTTNPALAEQLLRAISLLAVDDENEASFGRAGVATPLVRLLTAHPDLPATNPALAERLLRAIINLTVNKDNKTSFGRAGVAAPLVGLLTAHPNLPATSPAMAEQLLRAIRSLAVDDENEASFGRAGVATPLVGLLTSHPNLPATNPALAEELLRALANLTVNKDNKTSFGRAGVATPLVGLLTAHPNLPTTSPAVAEQLLRSIANLSVDDENKALFGRAGVVDPLVGLLTAHPNLPTTSPAVVQPVLWAISNLSCNDQNQPLFGRAGVATPLVRLLKDHPNLPATNPALAEQLLRAISNLSADNSNEASFGRAGVATPLVGLLTAHPNLLATSPALAQQLLRALVNLTVNKDNKTSFGRAGVAAPLVGLLTAHPNLPTTSPAVAEQLLRSIANLSVDDENKALFGRAGVVDPLVGLLTAHPNLPTTSPAVVQPVLWAISNLSCNDQNQPLFGRAGVATPLVRLLKDYPNLPATNPALAEQLLRAISNLSADNSNQPLFGRAGVATPLVRLLKDYPNLPATNPNLAEQLLRAIGNLSADNTNEASFGRAGVAAPLVGLLTAHPNLPATRPALAEQLLRTFANLTVDKDNKTSFGRAGVAAPLVGLLTAHPNLPTTNLVVAKKLIRVIVNLSADEENKASFGRAGAAAPLGRLLTAHPDLPADLLKLPGPRLPVEPQLLHFLPASHLPHPHPLTTSPSLAPNNGQAAQSLHRAPMIVQSAHGNTAPRGFGAVELATDGRSPPSVWGPAPLGLRALQGRQAPEDELDGPLDPPEGGGEWGPGAGRESCFEVVEHESAALHARAFFLSEALDEGVTAKGEPWSAVQSMEIEIAAELPKIDPRGRPGMYSGKVDPMTPVVMLRARRPRNEAGDEEHTCGSSFSRGPTLHATRALYSAVERVAR
ncbi:hypothetical protein PAPYR_10027 [Paratrimastix pyriformis]|uniref:Protein kinase domain-containing protein n=1 Tax=Paratrimastix pyriformis TaxID=342808 RepID=A0ABQ8U6Y4_9EUKA|nr:hypothetical protein PAPYR_10027 [Paratrimastix pyriformis]